MNDVGGKRHRERTLRDTRPPPGVSCAFRAYGALRTATFISPLLVGSNMDTLKQTQNKKLSDAEGIKKEPSDVSSRSVDQAVIFKDLTLEEPSTTTPVENAPEKINKRAARNKRRRARLAVAIARSTLVTPSAKKALGTSVSTVKPPQLKRRPAHTHSTPIAQAVPIPCETSTPILHSEFHIMIGQRGGKHLNEDHVQLFFETVADAMIDLASCSSFIPAFESCKIRNGKISITARNRASRDWLSRHLGKIRPWKGADLVVTSPAEKPSPIKYLTAVLWVPTARYSNEEIMQILESQNPELMVSSWKVLSRQPEPWGLTLKVDIDSRCVSALKDINFQPYFVLRRVDVKLTPNLKRKIPSDFINDTDTIGPTENKRVKLPPIASDVARKSLAFEQSSYSYNQQTRGLPSLLEMRTRIPSTSRMRSPMFNDSIEEMGLTLDERGNAVRNMSSSSRELDDTPNRSFSMEFSSRRQDSVMYEGSFPERQERDVPASSSLSSRRDDIFTHRKSSLENEPIPKRIEYSPPRNSYRMFYSPSSQRNDSSLVSYSSPQNYSTSGYSSSSTIFTNGQFLPENQILKVSDLQQQSVPMRLRGEPDSSRNISDPSRNVKKFHAPRSAARQYRQRR